MLRVVLFSSFVLFGLLPGCTTTPDAVPVHALSLKADRFDDLHFLAPLLEEKRIVQLGENTHGIREYNQIKSRLVQYLHQQLGYDVLIFESALYQCHDSNMTAATSPARSTLMRCTFGVWHTEAVLSLFEYLHETQATGRPLHLAGFDIQPIGGNKAGRPDFLSDAVSPIDPGYADEVFKLDSTFLAVYAQGGQSRRAYFRTEAGISMMQAYDELAQFLNKQPAASLNDHARVARQTATSMASYIRQQTAPSILEWFERRDKGMADNLRFLLEELYPDKKVIVWGHNFHLRHANDIIPPDSTMMPDVAVRTMGRWLHEWYGDAVYTVGLYAYEGEAMNNSGEVYPIRPAEPSTLEAMLHNSGFEVAFWDLNATPGQAQETVSARYNGETPLQLVPADQYDAIILIDQVSPRVMLY